MTDSNLLRLESRDLIRRLSEPDLAYLFKHALVQDTARASLLLNERKRLHRLVGEALEQVYPERRIELASLLCQHFSAAGEDDKALEYASLAGDAATRINANTEAHAHYTRAIELAERLNRPGIVLQDLYLKRGRTLELQNDYPAALENYDALAQLAKTRNDRNLELAALMAEATTRSIPSMVYNAILAGKLNHRALKLARELDDKSAQATILWNMMLVDSRVGKGYSTALARGEEALQIARENNLIERTAYILNDLSSMLVFKGQADLGNQYNLEARAMWIEFQNLPMLADNLGYAVMNHLLAGEFDLAISESQQALQISREINNGWNEAFAQTWIGAAYLERGEVTTAERVMLAAVALGDNYFPPTLVFTRSDLARLYTELGFPERGIELAKQALQVAEERFSAVRPVAIGALADSYLAAGMPEPVRELITENVDLTVFASNPVFGVDLVRSEIKLRLADGEYERALALTDMVLSFLRENKIRQFQPAALADQAHAYSGLGNVARAADRLYEALEIANEMAAQWSLWQVLAALYRLEAQRGNLELASDFRARAQALIERIAARTPEEYRTRFMERATAEL